MILAGTYGIEDLGQQRPSAQASQSGVPCEEVLELEVCTDPPPPSSSTSLWCLTPSSLLHSEPLFVIYIFEMLSVF